MDKTVLIHVKTVKRINIWGLFSFASQKLDEGNTSSSPFVTIALNVIGSQKFSILRMLRTRELQPVLSLRDNRF